MQYDETLQRFQTSFRVELYSVDTAGATTGGVLTEVLAESLAISYPVVNDYLPWVGNGQVTDFDVLKRACRNPNALVGTFIEPFGVEPVDNSAALRVVSAFKMMRSGVQYDSATGTGPNVKCYIKFTNLATGAFVVSSFTVTRYYNADGTVATTVNPVYGCDSLPWGARPYLPVWATLVRIDENNQIAEARQYGAIEHADENVYWTSYNATSTVISWLNGLGDYVPAPDPYTPGGNTEPSGPNTGTWTLINNDVDFPDLPEITASDTGFFSIWVPTLEQIQLLAGFMWNTDVLNIDFWKRMVTSPLELILGLALFPLDLDVDGHESLTLGLVDTRIDTNYRDAQFVDVDCGELDLEEYYGAFLDYAPFTQLDIYLPYIGVRAINTNDVMPKRLHLRYRIDLVSGSCVAMLKADGSIYYHWTGSCSVQIPVTTQQMQSLVNGAISAVGAVAGSILTGGISGALAAASGVASAAVNSSQHVGRSGTMGSAAGFLGVQTPYLIITRPRQAIPENQTRYTGYPTFITAKLGDLTGYTEIEAVHLHDIAATSDELDEIERLLGEGVIL